MANFICGLIILFECPVRVGDTVTIGNLSGTVSNIQIHATTLTDFDNLEVVLPNKSIISENVTNWTRHDAVTRITLSNCVADGSNIEQVRRLLIFLNIKLAYFCGVLLLLLVSSQVKERAFHCCRAR